MRVLAIGHNVMSESNNMGKTMLSYFRDFSPDEIAEFYIQEKEPKNASVARRYYRVTDREALKSVFGRKVGRAFRIDRDLPEEAAGKGFVETVRQYGEKRSALVYTLRNAVWALAHWKTKELRDWLLDFDPDVIFFMSGDYGFMYTVTLEIQKLLQKPLVVCCVDDFYLYNRNADSALGRWQHRAFMRTVRKLMDRASCILTISDLMGEAYGRLFDKPCHTLHTGAEKRARAAEGERKGLAYFGNLGLGRSAQLVEIGKTLKRLGLPGIDGIDVYSGEKNPENLVGLTEENGIRFHGEITSAELAARMDACLAIIHTESFDPKIQNMIRCSVSTKIADSLLNGPCLIAYGPEGIASIDYLKKNAAACVITRPEDLESGLREILTNAALREETVQNARALACQNHDAALTSRKLRAWLQAAIEEGTGHA